MSKKATPATPAPAPAQPAETEPTTVVPFGEGESSPGGSGEQATGTDPAPALGELITGDEGESYGEPEGETRGEMQPPEVFPEEYIDELPPIPIELIGRLVFVDPAGGRYYLDAWTTRGHYLLRNKPGG